MAAPTFHTYDTPTTWLGYLELPGFIVFVPADGSAPYVHIREAVV